MNKELPDDFDPHGFANLEKRVEVWALAQEDVRLAVVIGSRARLDHPADAWSDLDVLLFTHQPDLLLEDRGWLAEIGEVWMLFTEPSGGSIELRVMFAGGMDVDFVPLPVTTLESFISSGSLPADVADILRRGVRSLVDKDHLLPAVSSLLPPGKPEFSLDEALYANVVHDFWYHTVWTAKHMRRGELWWAKGCCDGLLKERLRVMLQWHAAYQHPGRDTWLRGRFLEEWADPRALAALPEIFAYYDAEDIWRALWTTMRLFAWLARETAQLAGVNYPESVEQHATTLVKVLDAGH